MRNYELTFIVDSVLSDDEIRATAGIYIDLLKEHKSEIVYINDWGLRQLAYPIKKRSTGVYFTIEFANETGHLVDEVELALRRDDRILRFLTVRLDKFGVKYNEDKRAGLIGAYKRKKDEERAAKAKEREEEKQRRRGSRRRRN